MQIPGSARPHLARGVRLRYDDVRSEWVLLAPERILKPNEPALAILEGCDGEADLDTIVDRLTRDFAAERDEIMRDAQELIGLLIRKRMVEL